MRKKMRKNLFCFILVSALTFQFCGCGEANQDKTNDSGTVKAENSGTSGGSGSAGGENSDPTGEDLFLSLENIPWRDNSLDAYSAVVNMPLRYTGYSQQEYAMGGSAGELFLGNTRASVYEFHYSEEAADRWDEIKAITDQGVETSFRIAIEGKQSIHVSKVGSIAGSDHYMMMTLDTDAGDGKLYRLYETDEDMQVLNSFYVDCLDKNDYEFPLQLRVDKQGNIHMITSRSDNTHHYYIVAPDGTFLMEASPKEGFPKGQTPDLFFLYDGRVGIKTEEKLQCVNLETGETETLANIKSDYRACTLLDEKTLLYANWMGLYRSGLSGEDPEILYTWNQHGVSASEIRAMQVTESGGISLIYMDYKGANYLKLEPTTEEVEIQEITFAIYGTNQGNYQSIVTTFNKKYPAYRIKMKTYGYDDMSLLTELMAGKGPVLMDTMLVNFKDNADWWEPLDEVFRQMQMDGELIPQVMDLGKINGTLYGVYTYFSLNTVVTFAEEPEEWDYDTFLSYFDENDPNLKSVYNDLGSNDGMGFIRFFLHGLEGKYLFDAENSTTRFDSEEFRKILRLARIFENREHQGTIEDVRQGTSPCAVVLIRNPDDLAELRVWGDGKLRFIGYPSGEGSRSYIGQECHPITVRVNATTEEKRLAHSFLQFLLSYEGQMEAVQDTSNINIRMSVRKDVLEEQINRVNEYSSGFLLGHAIGDQVDHELDKATLYGLLEKEALEWQVGAPRDLYNIFSGELNGYLSGDVTEDVLIEHLENRVGLYLMERK